MTQVSNGIIGKTIYTIIRGQDAKNLADHLGFVVRKTEHPDYEYEIEETDVNTKVWFRVRKIAGELQVEMELSV